MADRSGHPSPPEAVIPPLGVHPRLIGQYLLLEKLGQGGMGAVYKAQHTHLNRLVAIKLLPPDRLEDPQAAARFAREMQAVGALDHPHVVRATDAGEADGQPFLVMELLEGLDLAQLVRRCHPLPIADACELARQAALALQAVHERGLIHRDVKPSNLLLTDAGLLKLLDLGLARFETAGPPGERLTASNQVMGTADYMAPEQGLASGRASIRSDLYSLGCTLYKLLTGRVPFDDPDYNSFSKKLYAHAHAPWPPVADRRPEIPEGLAVVLGRLLAKNPDDRFPIPAEVVCALAPFTSGCDLARLVANVRSRALQSEGLAPSVQSPCPPETLPHVPARSGSSFEKTARRGVRWRWVACAAALAFLVAGALATWLMPSHVPDPPGPPLPGRWYPLLRQPPRPVYWPDVLGTSRYQFEGPREEVNVNAVDLGLLGLGQAPLGGCYKLQLRLQQNTWVGGLGLFLGYRQEPSPDGPVARYQTLELTSFLEHKPDRAFTLGRNRVVQACRGNTGPVKVERLAVTSAELARPVGHEATLEITVGPRGLLAVRWNSETLAKLSSREANAKFSPADYQGEFGVYAYRSQSVVRSASLMILEGEPP